MFPKAFDKLSRKKANDILRDLEPFLTDRPFDPERTAILANSLPFYPDYQYLEIGDHSTQPPLSRIALYKKDDIVMIDWTAETILSLNKRAAGFTLDRENVTDYVRFYLGHVASTKGRIVLAECVDDMPWTEEPPPAARKAMAKVVMPLQVAGTDKDGRHLLSATMIFEETLYKTKIHVGPAGEIAFSDQEILVEDIPLEDTVLSA